MTYKVCCSKLLLYICQCNDETVKVLGEVVMLIVVKIVPLFIELVIF